MHARLVQWATTLTVGILAHGCLARVSATPVRSRLTFLPCIRGIVWSKCYTILGKRDRYKALEHEEGLHSESWRETPETEGKKWKLVRGVAEREKKRHRSVFQRSGVYIPHA